MQIYIIFGKRKGLGFEQLVFFTKFGHNVVEGTVDE